MGWKSSDTAIFQKPDSLLFSFILIKEKPMVILWNIGYPRGNFFFLKVVRIWSYSDPHFSAFGLNKERYGVSHRIQSERGKIRTRITPNRDTFYAVSIYLNFRPSFVRFSEPFRTIIKPFWPMPPFYIPWKHKKTFSFPVFSGDPKLELWLEAG